MERWTERQRMIDNGATEAEATATYGSPDWVDPDPELADVIDYFLERGFGAALEPGRRSEI